MVSSSGFSTWTPALLITKSRPPHSSDAAVERRDHLILDGDVAGLGDRLAAAPISSATASAPSPLTSATTTPRPFLGEQLARPRGPGRRPRRSPLPRFPCIRIVVVPPVSDHGRAAVERQRGSGRKGRIEGEKADRRRPPPRAAAKRFSGTRSIACGPRSRRGRRYQSSSASIIGVSIGPGQTTLTRTVGASSAARRLGQADDPELRRAVGRVHAHADARRAPSRR